MNDALLTTERNQESAPGEQNKNTRKIICWIFALCNFLPFAVVLDVVHSILNKIHEQSDEYHSTFSSILVAIHVFLADIIPKILINLCYKFPFKAYFRIKNSCLVTICGLLVTAFSSAEWFALTGAALTSLALIGVSLLSLTSTIVEKKFLEKNKNMIWTWSSGAGGAGFFGALVYAFPIQFSNWLTLLDMVSVPIIQFIVYDFLIKHASSNVEEQQQLENLAVQKHLPSMKSIKDLAMISIDHVPLAIVYFFNYSINQGFLGLLYFPEILLTDSALYRWIQIIYQCGVFLMRASMNPKKLRAKSYWIIVLQVVNVILFSLVKTFSTPFVEVIFLMVFIQGLVVGLSQNFLQDV